MDGVVQGALVDGAIRAREELVLLGAAERSHMRV
jgi:hypothetical protein